MKRSWIKSDPVVERFAGLDAGPDGQVSKVSI